MTTATTQPKSAGTRRKKYSERVGAVRPSQILHTYGVGSLIDLPNFSVIVAGLQSWTHVYEDIVESRLLAAVRAELGPQVERLAAMPWQEPTDNFFDEWARIGIPVIPFPRWFRCTKCDVLSTIEGNMFTLEMHPTRLDRVRYVHNCNAAGKAPLAVPARFVIACTKGHLDEFPWKEFAHDFAPCPQGGGVLKLIEPGSGTRSTEVFVKCEACGKSNLVGKAFDTRNPMPKCRGRHPHLRTFEACEETAQTLLLGASNTWFGIIRSALALPEPTLTPLDEDVVASWKYLDDPEITDEAELAQAIKHNPFLRRLKGFAIEDVWAAIQRRKHPQDGAAPADLKHPEWDYFISPASAPRTNEFTIDDVNVPRDFADQIQQIVAATRLRETSALIGFARIEAPDSGLAADADDSDMVALTTGHPTWVPANDTRGEGIFIRLPEDGVQQWESAAGQHERVGSLKRAIESDGKRAWPGARYALLHSLSHLLINELALECGYSAAALRERIYCDTGEDGQEPIAGILIYTAAADSEGTLGGLVAMAKTDTFERVLKSALQRAELCTSDPLCAEHQASIEDRTMHGAACHSCLFVPETSCERNNRLLDRATLVETLTASGIAYFGQR